MSSPVSRLTLKPAFATLLRSCNRLSQSQPQDSAVAATYTLLSLQQGSWWDGGEAAKGGGELCAFALYLLAAPTLMLLASCS